MLQVLKQVDNFEDDDELFVDLIDQYRRAFEDDPEMKLSEFFEGELFPEDEFIYDTRTGVMMDAAGNYDWDWESLGLFD